jgi:hypothetical protein
LLLLPAVAQITQAVASLVTKRRLLISGTPIQNDLTEFYAVFNTALPGEGPSPSAMLELSVLACCRLVNALMMMARPGAQRHWPQQGPPDASSSAAPI